ncbi:MAG: YfhO family protein [Rubrobacter sp.]|nr:YfhO family protein [Rubrobacter sp.]
MDVAAVLFLLVLTVISQWRLLRGGTVVGIDSATQFYPWYSYLGERLRSGDVPGWNPHLFSGVPFAADPLSGWSYLPAMLLFTLLPLTAAAEAYMFLHPLLAGLFTYGLARALRLDVAGALLAAVAYEFSGYLYVRNTCCFAYVSVVTWLPLAILGAEMAIRSPRWTGRGLWWGVSGLALSQILASWLGQGSYYALLALGGYVAYRTLISPPENIRGVAGRFLAAPLHGGAVLVFGFGLAAAGFLPRLEYNALSGLAGGYADPVGGWAPEDWKSLFVIPDVNYLGAAVLALVLSAPLICRGRFGVPYFAVLCLAALTLSMKDPTPLHSGLYLLPGFEALHHHFPQRVMSVFYLGAGLLAGATLTVLGRRGPRTPYLILPPALAAAFLVTRSTPVPSLERPEDAAGAGPWGARAPYLLEHGISLLPGALVALALVLLLTMAYALLPARRAVARGIVSTLLVLVVFADLFGAGLASLEGHEALEEGRKVFKKDLRAYYAPTDVTRFLQSDDGGLSRYVGYRPEAGYNAGFRVPDIRALEAENRAILREGLYSVQGYNSVHLARYDEYMETTSGGSQGYHGSNVLSEGPGSPLFDLLNIRYVVVPAEIDPDGPENLRQLEYAYPTVHQNDRVKVLENEDALPRAWIVHSARRARPARALELLGSGAVDPRRTALLEEPSPNLAEPDDPSSDRVSVTEYEADEIELKTSTGTRGLLVLSEVYYPAWKAYVDGEPVPVRRADHLLRAVPVPAGEHTVELRYESWTLSLGISISLAAGLTLLVLAFARMRPADGGVSRDEPPQRTNP